MTTFTPPSAALPRPAGIQTAPAANPSVPAGTFAPGTKVQVGKHRVVIERYLSEGGFAHVYVVQVPSSSGKTAKAVLKRVAVPDKEALAEMRTEVETMKKLKGHRHIVTYIDSHASGLKSGGYEVFLLMEYCDGGGLIDFMNTRLKNRLTEPEILKIFTDAAEGVACMHYLKPPLLHRDLKVENILIANTPAGKEYKLCDFGSSAPPRPAATSAAEGRLIEEDVQRHTTLQYRSPEMIDVYRKRPIDEKSDIWALGVLLYKLCYYTTPFEEQGQMAIMKASFKYPPQPRFSDKLKLLIATMLSEDPKNRPNIYQVLNQACGMQGKEVPVKDIYANRTPSEARRQQQLPSREAQVQSPPMVGAYQVTPELQKQIVPEVTPMRRGRPTTQSDQRQSQNLGRPEAAKSTDPFAALDSANYDKRAKAVDELSSKYPALDDFSLLQSQDSKFKFQGTAKDDSAQPLNKRLTNALADEAFAGARGSLGSSSQRSNLAADVARQASLKSTTAPDADQAQSMRSASAQQLAPARPTMVSTGTMTSPAASPKEKFRIPAVDSKPIWRVPSSSSRNRLSDLGPAALEEPSLRSAARASPNLPDGASQSSRNSLEGGRPSMLEVTSGHRSKSAETRHRFSTENESNVRSPSATGLGRSSRTERPSSALLDDSYDSWHADGDDSDGNISSNVEFLRTMEGQDAAKGHHRRHSSRHKIKQASLPSQSRSGRRNLLSGKFGEAFRRFDMNSANRTPSPKPLVDANTDHFNSISADETAESLGLYEDDLDETEELSPEVRRELERQRLSQEERRVAEAQAAYREQLARGDAGRRSGAAGVSRASTIQNRVKNLLDESGRASPAQKTAEGYGKYTDAPRTGPLRQPSPEPTPPVADIPAAPPASAPPAIQPTVSGQPLPTMQTAPTRSRQNAAARPAAPPKPVALRTGGSSRQGNDARAQEQGVTAREGDDWETDFSQRYPSLSLEMVETEIAAADTPPSRPVGLRVKDV